MRFSEHRVLWRSQLHPTAFVAEGAVLTGDVTIGRDSSVWFGAVLRADVDAIRIGEETNIQDGSILHVDKGMPVVLGNRVTLGHGAIVHAARIHDRVLVAIRAVVLSGATVHENCIIGAGAVVMEKAVIPPNSLVLGVPGRVVRTLGPEHVAQIERSARHYVEYARRYRGADDTPIP